MIRTKRIASGGWRTVETFWNAKGIAFFKVPSGAQIKVRYGGGWLGFDRQKQTLNGNDYKKLEIGLASLAYARMQVKVSQTTDVTYDVYGGGVARSFARNKVLSFGIHGARQSIKDLSVRWNADGLMSGFIVLFSR